MGAVWGRDAELALACDMLAPDLTEPLALVLRGEEGVGRTTLWQAVLSAAEDRGYRVLSARPVESEATFAFAAVADLLRDGLEEALPSLPDPQRAALEAALLRAELEGSPDPRAVAFGFTGCLRVLARSGPLVVGVDDVQWLDAPSARVLSFALRRLDGVPVAVVLSSRAAADAADPSPLGLDGGPLAERIHRVPIGPLDPEALRHVLVSKLDVRFHHWVLVRIHEASGGNPFLALELGRALVRRGIELRPGQALPMPQRLTALLSERLAGLSDPVRRMLLLVSASARPTLPSISAALAGPLELDELLGAALDSEVLEIAGDRVRFANPLLGTAIYSEASPEERRRAHRMLADVSQDAEERARHLALAAEGPDEQIAGALEDAARRARSHGAPESAAQLAELSRALTPPDRVDALVRRTAQAGRYAFESAQMERAEELLEEAAAASSGPARAEALLYLSRVRYHRRDAPSAAALADEALHEASEDPSLQASINLELAAAAELSGDHRTATERARLAVELAERSGDRTITAESVAVKAFYGFVSGDGFPAAQIERAKDLQGPGPPVRPLRSAAFYEACMRRWSDDLRGARDGLRELERRARDSGDEGSLSVLLALLSEIDSLAGDWVEAGRLAEESRTLAGWTAQPIYLSLALYAAALVEGLRGEADRAFALAGEGLELAEQTGSVQTGEYARSVLGSVELSRGDARAADRWLSGLVEAMQARGDADPGTVRFVPDEVEALIGIDEVDRAEALLSPFQGRAETLGRWWAQGSAARCRGMVLASRRELDEAIRALDRALEYQRALGQPLELGRTYLTRGSVFRRGKKWAPARESLERALLIFEGLGAALWAERARSELARIGGRSPGRTALTETEARVAELVATGLTNREVAARLFVSVSTVESNLRRAFRKLGVRSRAELSHKLASSDLPS